MKTILFSLLFCVTASLLYAQDSTGIQKSFSLSQGYTHILTKDLYRSPYNYKGLSPNTELSFERSSSRSIHRAYAGLVWGTVKTDFSPLAPSSVLTVNYSYLRKLTSGKRFTVYLGPQLNGLSSSTNYFPDMPVPAHGRVHSYILDFSLGLAGQINYRINAKNSLHVFFSAPLCAYVDRPEFMDGSPRQIQFGVFNSWNPQVRFTFEHRLSKKVSVLLNYQYTYLHYEEPKAIRMLTNGFSLGLKLNFK